MVFDVLEHVLDPAATPDGRTRYCAPVALVVSFTPLEGQPFSFYRFYRRLFGDELYVDTKEHLHAFSERGSRCRIGFG